MSLFGYASDGFVLWFPEELAIFGPFFGRETE